MDWILVEKLIPAPAKTPNCSVYAGIEQPKEISLLSSRPQNQPIPAFNQIELLDEGWQRCVDRNLPQQSTEPSLPAESSNWVSVHIPDHYGMDDRLADYHGPVWYRRIITRPTTGDRLTLRFSAVDYLADVYLNQIHIGHHEGYFAPFQFDLTDLLAPGETANLVIRVQDPLEILPTDAHFPRQRKQWIKGGLSLNPDRPGGLPGKPSSSWDSSSIQNPPTGGLTGEVKLLSTGAVRLDALFATPLTLDGEFHLAIILDSCLPESATVHLGLQFQAPDGTVDGSLLSFKVTPGANRLDLETHCPTPVVWKDSSHRSENTDSPLYAITASVITNEASVSSLTIRFGFRLASWNTTPSLHFELNRQKLFLRGVNISSPKYGSYLSPEACQTDLQVVLNANLNSIGLSSHIQTQLVYDLADQMGILIQQEFPLYGSYASGEIENPDFTPKASDMAAEMIYTLWNHPSVISYTLHAAPPYALLRLLKQQYTQEGHFAISLKDKIELKAIEYRLGQKVFPPIQSDNPQNDGFNRFLDLAMEKVIASIDPNAGILSHLSSGQIADDYRGSRWGGDLYTLLPADVPLISGYGSVHISQTALSTTDRWAYPWPPDRSRMDTLSQETWHWMELIEMVGSFERYPDLAAFAYATERKSSWMAKYWTEMYRILRDRPYSGYRWATLVNDDNWISCGLLDPDRQPTHIFDAIKSSNRSRLAATHLSHTLLLRGDQVLPIYLINDTDQEWQTIIHWKLERLKKCELITAEPDRRMPRWIPHLHGSIVLPVPGALEELRRGEISGIVPSQSTHQIGTIRQSFTRYGAYHLILSWMENGKINENDFTFLITPDHWEPEGGLAIIDSLELQKKFAFKY